MTPGTLTALEHVLDRCGWDQVGGRLIRDPLTDQVTDRTVWIPRERWGHGRPEGLTEKRARRVVSDALGGCRLGPRQRRYLAWLVAVAGDYCSNGGRFEEREF